MFAQNPQPTPTTIATASTPTAVTPVPPAPTAVAPISSIPGDSGHLPAPVSGISAVVPRAEAGSTASASQSQPTPPVSSYMSPLRMRSAVSSRSIGGVSLSTQPSSSPFQSITAIECANNTRLDHAAQVLGNSSSTRRKKRGLGRKAPQLHGVAESAKVEDFFSVADVDDEETNDDNNEEFGMLKAPAFTNSKKSKFDLGSKFGSGKLGFMDLGFSSDDLTASTTSNDASHASVPPPDAWNSSSKPVQKCLRLEFVFETCSKNSSHSSSPLAPPAPPAPAPPAPPAHVPGFSLPQGIVPDQVAPSKIGVFAIGTSGSVKRTTYGILGGSQKPEIVTKEGGGMIEQVSPKEIELGKTLLNSIHHPPNSTVWCLPRFHIHMLPINTPSSQPDHPPFLTNTLNFPLNQLILRALYAFRRARATSSADGGGFLYAFVDHGYRWKVGMSPDFERSRKEWDQQCPCEDRIRMNPIATTRRRRAESELDTGEGTAIPPGLESSSSMIIQKMVMLIIVLVDHSESDTSISEVPYGDNSLSHFITASYDATVWFFDYFVHAAPITFLCIIPEPQSATETDESSHNLTAQLTQISLPPDATYKFKSAPSLARLHLHTAPVSSIASNSSGTHLLTSSWDTLIVEEKADLDEEDDGEPNKPAWSSSFLTQERQMKYCSTCLHKDQNRMHSLLPKCNPFSCILLIVILASLEHVNLYSGTTLSTLSISMITNLIPPQWHHRNSTNEYQIQHLRLSSATFALVTHQVYKLLGRRGFYCTTEMLRTYLAIEPATFLFLVGPSRSDIKTHSTQKFNDDAVDCILAQSSYANSHSPFLAHGKPRPLSSPPASALSPNPYSHRSSVLHRSLGAMSSNAPPSSRIRMALQQSFAGDTSCSSEYLPIYLQSLSLRIHRNLSRVLSMVMEI
ncbi:hypothetical protein C8R42DRAFT_725457 [Lentinula raphanica]|nr:hypothetical protein C8R42DRAFT_725457 [Lentinula raphanica]